MAIKRLAALGLHLQGPALIRWSAGRQANRRLIFLAAYANPLKRLNGAKEREYREAGYAYAPRNGPFQTAHPPPSGL